MSERPSAPVPPDASEVVGSHDLATLSAVADFVIKLSIGARNHQIYGPDHPTAAHSLSEMESSLHRALELCDPLELHFTPEAIFCGVQCLERGHPIYRRFAERMWSLGVVGLSFVRGLTSTELATLIELLNRSQTESWGRRRTEKELRESALPHVRTEFLHELVSYRHSDEVSTVSPSEQEGLWEDFMAQLAQFRALGPSPEKRSDSTDRLSLPEFEGDYAEAVIDYLKQLQRSKHQDVLLSQTDFGQKISQFLGDVNPNLRHQIMSSAIRSNDVSPETLHRLVGLVGQEQLIESLQRLNDTGESIPPTAFRTLSLLTMVSDLPGGPPGGDSAPTPQESERIGQLLDGLMAADRASTYTSPEYEETIRNIESHAGRLTQSLADVQFELNLSLNEAEKHFLLAANRLLDRSPDSVVARRIRVEAEQSYSYFIEAGVPTQCRQAMKLARRARSLNDAGDHAPFVWETDEILRPLTERLTGGDRWESEDSTQLLTTIGTAAVPALIDVLLSSESLSARKRTLATLIAMEESPAPYLLPLLERHQPWYVQRNAVHILRQRLDPAGLTAAKYCWKTRRRRLQLEILDYLLALEDPQGIDYLWSALHHPDRRMVLDVFRTAVKSPRDDVVEALQQRIDGIPSVLVGSRYHLSLLRLLLRTDHPRARLYVERTRHDRKALFGWTRRSFDQGLEELLEG